MNPVTNYCQAVLGDNPSARAALRLIPEFADCSETLLDMVYTYSKPVDLKPGEVLIQEGLFDQWTYFIIKGDVDVMIAGKHLGSTNGPIVGERCILGEPRGANLVAGKTGLLALGVEMTIIDQLNREVNDFQKKATNENELQQFSEAKMQVGLELLVIILREVLGRIINLHRSSNNTLEELKKTRPELNIRLKSIYSFLDPDPENAIRAPAHNISVYNFEDFADIIYFELLQKNLSEASFDSFSQETWREIFSIDDHFSATITRAFDWLKKEFALTNSKLIDITYSIFEVASKYLAVASHSISDILSISDCEEEKEKVLIEAAINERVIDENSQNLILENLFIPVEQKLSSNQSNDIKAESGKMSQADIDAMFG